MRYVIKLYGKEENNVLGKELGYWNGKFPKSNEDQKSAVVTGKGIDKVKAFRYRWMAKRNIIKLLKNSTLNLDSVELVDYEEILQDILGELEKV